MVDVHGPRNKILKGEFYEQNYPFNSLQLTRDTNYHKSQRRVWDKAFHNKGIVLVSDYISSYKAELLRSFARVYAPPPEALLDLTRYL